MLLACILTPIHITKEKKRAGYFVNPNPLAEFLFQIDTASRPPFTYVQVLRSRFTPWAALGFGHLN